jgi:hypothetical protein
VVIGLACFLSEKIHKQKKSSLQLLLTQKGLLLGHPAMRLMWAPNVFSFVSSSSQFACWEEFLFIHSARWRSSLAAASPWNQIFSPSQMMSLYSNGQPIQRSGPFFIPLPPTGVSYSSDSIPAGELVSLSYSPKPPTYVVLVLLYVLRARTNVQYYSTSRINVPDDPCIINNNELRRTN